MTSRKSVGMFATRAYCALRYGIEPKQRTRSVAKAEFVDDFDYPLHAGVGLEPIRLQRMRDLARPISCAQQRIEKSHTSQHSLSCFLEQWAQVRVNN